MTLVASGLSWRKNYDDCRTSVLTIPVHTKHARGYQNVFISSFVQLEDVTSNLDIINKKSNNSPVTETIVMTEK